MRYLLVEGQGNFGSMDGDPPAAMRYTEVRMSTMAEMLLEDIEKDTVDFVPNYDGSLREPVVLPSRVPNLLVNGSSGIAVGMATNIPPHNLTEICDAIIYLVQNPRCSIEELMDIVKGPDFPTRGMIIGSREIKEAYRTGKGIITVRGRAYIEREKGERETIVITEIPYMVNKAKLIEKIAELARQERIRGVADIRDESDREGMRIIVEIKRGENSGVVLKQLYKLTPLQTTFGIILLALHHNQPKLLNLKEALDIFVSHRREVIRRRTHFELERARQREHILEGLKVAVDNLDRCIELIRASKNPAAAREALMKEFDITEIQAKAILDMKLEKLTALERQAILDELKQIKKLIDELESILRSDKKVNDLIIREITEVKEKFGDERKTDIVEGEKDFSDEELIPEENMVVIYTRTGYIKRIPLTLFRSQRRGGKGVKGLEVRQDDIVDSIFMANTKDYMMFFTDKGRVYWLRVHQIPQAGRLAKGIHVKNLIQLQAGENVAACLNVREFSADRYVFFVTRSGIVKKTTLSAFSNPRVTGISAIELAEGNTLVNAFLTDGKSDIVLVTARGKGIRFSESGVRPMARTAHGVRGISLSEGDAVVCGVPVEEGKAMLIVSARGYGKRVNFSAFRRQNRGGGGVIAVKVTEKTGRVINALPVSEDDEVILTSTKGKIIKFSAREVSQFGRAASGVRIMKCDKDEEVADVAIIRPEEA